MGRLIYSIVSTILEELVFMAVVLWGLPHLNIRIPLWGLILIMLAWTAFSVFTYRLGSRALERKELGGLSNMIGSRGEVVSPLAPDGLVKIKGELWAASSVSGEISEGREVIVVGQQRLKLIVRDSGISAKTENSQAENV